MEMDEPGVMDILKKIQMDMSEVKRDIKTNADKQTKEFKKLSDEVISLRELVSAQAAKIDTLKEEKDALCMKVDGLEVKLNDQEQYQRNNCVRIHGLALPEAESSDGGYVMQKVYDDILEPILKLAVAAGTITEVPLLNTLLVNGHVLPSRDKAKPLPIILRFASKYYRSLVFKYKKQFFTSSSPTVPGGRPTKHPVSIFEDLTPINSKKLWEMKQNIDIESAWSMNGRLKYTLKIDTNTTKTLKSPFLNIY